MHQALENIDTEIELNRSLNHPSSQNKESVFSIVYFFLLILANLFHNIPLD